MSDFDTMLRALIREEIRRNGAGTPPARALTVRQVAERLAVDQKTVRRMVQRGELRAIRVGAKALRVLSSDVEALLTQATE